MKKQVISLALIAMVTLLASCGNNIANKVKETASQATNEVTNTVSWAVNEVKETTSEATDKVADTVSWAVNEVKETVNEEENTEEMTEEETSTGMAK